MERRKFVQRSGLGALSALLGAEISALARESGVPVETDISVFLALHRGPLLGVTGSKGKSTVASWTWKPRVSRRKRPPQKSWLPPRKWI